MRRADGTRGKTPARECCRAKRNTDPTGLSPAKGHPRQCAGIDVRRLSLLLVFLCALGQAQAETRYVTDRCSVPLRKGESAKYKILRMLPSGTTLQVVAVGAESGFAQVRTQEGTVGFVATSELQAEPPAREQLPALTTRLAELQQAPDALATRLGALQAEHTDLKTEHDRVKRERDQLQQELATLRSASANIVAITNDRAELRNRVAELTRKAADLEQENRDLNLQKNQRWFLIGAGVVGLGVLIGFLLPNLRLRRRKSSWGSL
jgi:SH3 domain protein